MILKRGDSGETVVILQNRLNEKADRKISVDGDFGFYTQREVKRQQMMNNLKVTGFVDDIFWDILNPKPEPEIQIPNSLAEKLLVNEASRWVGVTEQGGNNHGQMVEIFQMAADKSADGESWCASFAICYCTEQADKQYKIVDPNAKEKLLFVAEHCMTVWRNTPVSQRVEKPYAGCIVIWQHYSNGVPTENGHTGIVTKATKDFLYTIEGNTGKGDGIVRDGDGVYARKRKFEGEGDMKLVGFLKVW
jgi:hypothetical protein